MDRDALRELLARAEADLAKSPAHFTDYMEWKGYKRGVQDSDGNELTQVDGVSVCLHEMLR